MGKIPRFGKPIVFRKERKTEARQTKESYYLFFLYSTKADMVSGRRGGFLPFSLSGKGVHRQNFMNEHKARLAKILRTQAQAMALMVEVLSQALLFLPAYEKAVLLLQQTAEEMATLSNEVDESALTQVALASHSFVEELEQALSIYHEWQQKMQAILSAALKLEVIDNELAEKKESEAHE